MSDAQASWLRKLRDEGPQGTRMLGDYSAVDKCRIYGWSDVENHVGHRITPKGLDALAAHEGEKE